MYFIYFMYTYSIFLKTDLKGIQLSDNACDSVSNEDQLCSTQPQPSPNLIWNFKDVNLSFRFLQLLKCSEICFDFALCNTQKYFKFDFWDKVDSRLH